MRTRLNLLFVFVSLVSGCAKPADPPRIPPQASDVPLSWPGQGQTDVLVFSGMSVWRAEIDSIKRILYKHGATYEEISADTMNAFTQRDFLRYKLLIFPGGYAPSMVQVLNPATRAFLRVAVQQGGVNYLGFCAGAWISVGPAPAPGQDLAYGLGVADGPYLDKNFLGKKGLDHALDKARFPDGTRRDLLWYGGPVTPELRGGVVARYSDGTPAISQMRSGRGFVIASGLHPAATREILDYLNLGSSEAVAPDLAWSLLKAGIQGTPLPAF